MEPITSRRIGITPGAARPLSSGPAESCGAAERGMALITVIMVMMLISALMVGFMSAIMADNKSSGLDHDQTQAYAAAHAGLEKLTADLSGLFAGDVSPGRVQINALLANKPTVDHFVFKEPDDTTGYKVTWDFVKTSPPFPAAQAGDPDVESATGSTITHGPYQGFKGLITPYNIVVTARSIAGGAEVRMKRTLQTIAVPVFQFGIFSETDLAFHAGETFTFGGRVHTNGNLFLAEATGETLTISDRITAVGDVIRTHLPNGLITTTGYTGTIRIPTTIMANPANNVYRNLARDEGSAVGTVGSTYNTKWTGLSKNTYTLNIRTGDESADGIGTGAKKLDLPIVDKEVGTEPIDLVRRPLQDSDENTTNKLIYQQRYYGHRATSLRILLSDTAAEITKLPALDTTTAPVNLSTAGSACAGGRLSHPSAARAFRGASGRRGPSGKCLQEHRPAAHQRLHQDRDAAKGHARRLAGRDRRDSRPGHRGQEPRDQRARHAAGEPLERCGRHDLHGNQPERGHPPSARAGCAVQYGRDRDEQPRQVATSRAATRRVIAADGVSQRPTDYWPNALYDPREGHVRDGLDNATTELALGGIMSYVELDMANLKKWLNGTTGASGGNAQNENGNGFIVYFSDRRNNKNPNGGVGPGKCGTITAPCETGEYGWENMVNLADANGTTLTDFDPGENVNGNKTAAGVAVQDTVRREGT